MFPTRILVTTDAPDEAYPAVEAAMELANGTTSGLQVVFVVSTAPELPYPKFIAKERNEAYLEQKRLGELRLLQHQARRVEEMGGRVAVSHYREGNPEREVVKLGREIGAGLTVTGAGVARGSCASSDRASPQSSSARRTARFWWSARGHHKTPRCRSSLPARSGLAHSFSAPSTTAAVHQRVACARYPSRHLNHGATRGTVESLTSQRREAESGARRAQRAGR